MRTVPKLLNCELCEKKFNRFCDMEIHLKTEHKKCQEFLCSKCEKTFVTQWRMRKHISIHRETNTKPCIYFISSVKCPFEELGCKFLHIDPEEKSEKVANYIENDNVGELEDKSFDLTNDLPQVITSTPKRTKKQCEECIGELECINCMIRNTDSLLRNKFGKHIC